MGAPRYGHGFDRQEPRLRGSPSRAAEATPLVAARRVRGLSDTAIAWLFIAPTIILLLAINIFPLIWTIYLSFTNYQRQPAEPADHQCRHQVVPGRYWARPISGPAMQATAHFVFWTILLQTLIGFALAYLIDRKFRGHAFWTTIILIPMMLSPAVVGNFWKFLYQPQIGLFNYIVSFFTGIPPSSFEMLGSVTLAPWAIVIVDTWMWTPYVMLICLAGLRSIPDYIYEAAEVDRASPWRQFWSITLPMALPFIMLAVLFRGIENFKMFDMVILLTGGGPGSTTELASITLKREAFEKLAHRLFLGFRHHSVRRRVRPRQHLRQGLEPGEADDERRSQHRAFGRRAVASGEARRRLAGHPLRAHLHGPAVLDFRHRLEDAARFDLLSAEDRFRALARRLLQPVHHAHPADRRIYPGAGAARGHLR